MSIVAMHLNIQLIIFNDIKIFIQNMIKHLQFILSIYYIFNLLRFVLYEML